MPSSQILRMPGPSYHPANATRRLSTFLQPGLSDVLDFRKVGTTLEV